MAITEAYTGSSSISTSEYSLTSDSTSLGAVASAGIYQLFLDLNALTAAEAYALKVYEKVRSGDTQRRCTTLNIAGVQADPILVMPSLLLLNGWEMTLTKTAGTARTIGWSIRKVA